jgi:hypothetical protein
MTSKGKARIQRQGNAPAERRRGKIFFHLKPKKQGSKRTWKVGNQAVLHSSRVGRHSLHTTCHKKKNTEMHVPLFSGHSKEASNCEFWRTEPAHLYTRYHKLLASHCSITTFISLHLAPRRSQHDPLNQTASWHICVGGSWQPPLPKLLPKTPGRSATQLTATEF